MFGGGGIHQKTTPIPKKQLNLQVCKGSVYSYVMTSTHLHRMLVPRVVIKLTEANVGLCEGCSARSWQSVSTYALAIPYSGAVCVGDGCNKRILIPAADIVEAAKAAAIHLSFRWASTYYTCLVYRICTDKDVYIPR